MKNYKIALPLFVITLLCFGLFSSCSDDNPINTKKDQIIIDSNFFNWEIDTARWNSSSGHMYIADTNKIFIAGVPYGIFFDNGILKKIYYRNVDPNFNPYCVNGLGENNVFFGGSRSSSVPYGYTPKLKKWDGSGIIDIEFPKDSGTAIMRIEAISNDDIWLSTSSNIIYHYYNSQVTTYKLDSGLKVGATIRRINSVDLYATAAKYSTNNVLFFLIKYDYVNDNWKMLFKDSITSQSEVKGIGGVFDNKFIGVGTTGYYYYDFSSNFWNWIKFLNTGNTLTNIIIGGSSLNSVLFNATEQGLDLFLYYYNGNQIYRQWNYHFTGQLLMDIQYKYGKFYFYVSEDDNTYVGIGKFKNTIQNNFKYENNEKNNNLNNRNNVIE